MTTMEFRYKVRPLRGHLDWLVPMVVLLLFYLFSRIVERIGIVESVIDLIIFGNVWWLFIGIRTYLFYQYSDTTTLNLDDEAISLYENGKVTQIRWDDIEKVNWEYVVSRGFRFIVIKGKQKQIIVGTQIVELPQFMKFVKVKVGDKFNTSYVPIEYLK